MDLKNNPYLLSLVAGIIGTLINLVVDKVSNKDEDKKPTNYMNYLKVFVVITITVLCVLLYTKGDKTTSVKSVTNSTTEVSSVGSISNVPEASGGLQEVNMSQNIHTGNPQF